MPEQSKAEFVRSLPSSMPAKEVIAKAKEKGIKLSPAYVYVIRSKSGSAKIQSPSKRGPKMRSGAGTGALEKQFISLALELGFFRAQAILNDVRARIQRSI